MHAGQMAASKTRFFICHPISLDVWYNIFRGFLFLVRPFGRLLVPFIMTRNISIALGVMAEIDMVIFEFMVVILSY